MIAAADTLCTLEDPNAADAVRGVANERTVHALLRLQAEGKSLEACAAVLGRSAATLCRLLKRHRSGEDLSTRHGNAGRRKVANTDVFTPGDIAFVKRVAIELESLPLALETLSDNGVCSPEAREAIDRYRESGDYPPSFYRLFRVTEEEREMAKGPKHFDGKTHTARRGMWYVDELGRRVELFSGDLFEADDVSIDVPYYLQLPDGSYSVGRQVLCFRDRRSRKWLGAYAVARERDSYRGEDIARATRELVLAWGLLGRGRFERGAWESSSVMGVKLSMGDDTRFGGFDAILPIHTVFTSRSKGTIEGGFRMLHKMLGAEGVRIGKTRGEYEQASADMLAVNAGRKTPQQCGFIPWSQVLAAFERTFTRLNGRPVFFQELGRKIAPDDAWSQDMQARPGGALPACPADQLWRFLPAKREVGASVAQAGHVKVSLPDYPLPFFFRIGGHGADGSPLPFIERGHRLLVCFDPQRAADGAVILNADAGPRNTHGWSLGQILFTAPLAGEAPQFNLAGTAGASDDIQAKKMRNQQVRASFTSIGLYGQGARRVKQDHDGRGNVARVESGAPARIAAAAAGHSQALPNPRAEDFAPALQSRRGDRAPAVPASRIEDFTTPASRPAPARAALVTHIEDLDLT